MGELAAPDPVTAVHDCLTRIAAVDGQLGAVLAINPTAVDSARASARRHRSGRVRSRLDGVPVLVKDNIDTADMPTTAGSRLLTGVPHPVRDAVVVRRLLRAGAVLIGKANLSEWSNIRSPRSTSGWSGVGGQAHNPHVLDRDPSGSSSGSAAAVAAGLVRFAVGTETDGSVLSPAAHCGVVGVKPSLGLLSRTGIVPITAAQDTAGALATTVADAATLLLACCGGDAEDPPSRTRGAAGARRNLAELIESGALTRPDPSGAAGRRIGVWRRPDPAGQSSGADAQVFDAVLDRLAAAGYRLVEVGPPPAQIAGDSWQAMLSELRRDLDRYLADRRATTGAGPASLSEVVAGNRVDPVELSRFGQELFETALEAPDAADPVIRRARQRARASALDWIGRWGADGCSVVVTSGGPAAAPLRYAHDAATGQTAARPTGAVDNGGEAGHLASSTPAAVAGTPSVSIPVGMDGPLPLGLTVLGRPVTDAELLVMAHEIEVLAGIRPRPAMLPTVSPPPVW